MVFIGCANFGTPSTLHTPSYLTDIINVDIMDTSLKIVEWPQKATSIIAVVQKSKLSYLILI